MQRVPREKTEVAMIYRFLLLPLLVLFLCSVVSAGDLPTPFQTRYLRVVQCMGIQKPPKPPSLRLRPTTACPTSQARCCLAGVNPYPCPYDRTTLCGDGGQYSTKKKRIKLPDECTDAFEHEVIHHVLRRTTGRVDAAHRSAFFALCGQPTEAHP